MTKEENIKKKNRLAAIRRKYFNNLPSKSSDDNKNTTWRAIGNTITTWSAVAILLFSGSKKIVAQNADSIAAQPQKPTKDLIAEGTAKGKDFVALLAEIDVKKIDDYMADSSLIKTAIENIDIDIRIKNLAGNIVNAAVDSTSSRIEQRLGKTSQQLVPEIKADFLDATGRKTVNKSCLVSLMAAYKRAIKALGYNELAEYLPQSLTLCRSFIHDKKAKPFVHRVKNNPQAIEEFIRQNNFSAGSIVFFPRQVLKGNIVNYHATSVEKAEDGSMWFAEGEDIKLQANNRVAKDRSVESYSNYARRRCPGKDVYIFNLHELVEYSLKQVVATKENRSDTLKYLYQTNEEFKNDIMMSMPILPQMKIKPETIQESKVAVNERKSLNQAGVIRRYRRSSRGIA